MKKMVIESINKYIYHLVDEKDIKYVFNLEFINLEDDIIVGDVIYIDEGMLEEKQSYTFGPVGSIYGKSIDSSNEKDIIVIEKKDKKIYLQRYYG